MTICSLGKKSWIIAIFEKHNWKKKPPISNRNAVVSLLCDDKLHNILIRCMSSSTFNIDQMIPMIIKDRHSFCNKVLKFFQKLPLANNVTP